MIQISALSKKYKQTEHYAIKSLDLHIESGEIYGLLGPNGAGKTTLISILCGLIKPTEGHFEIQGLTYKKQPKQLKQLLGVVPQEYALYPTLTATENLLFFGQMYGLHGMELKKRIREHIEHLGLQDFAHKRIETFSGGMKRRVNLIAAILHRPQLLFLDEPTVGVDVQSKTVIIDYLKKLNEKKTTIIYTSHHLNEAEEFCSKVGIIDYGQLIAKGTPKDLIQSYEGIHNLEQLFLHLTGKTLRDHA